MRHPIITLEQAKADFSPSQLRSVARSLERIASKGYRGNDPKHDIPALDARSASRNAYNLRRLSKEI